MSSETTVIQQSCDEEKSQLGSKNITYNEIAGKLLQDKFLLTALELHTELVEAGKEIRQLKDFFSNPGNFEFQTHDLPTHLTRSGSQVTLDSLDLTRYSEDGGGTDERVAVLEFELRKAKDTINALRNNLTVATESENNSPTKGQLNPTVGGIKPHEQRALNFLINEYLLIHGYKLTSITFADENQSQDFDDWDDVGLNIAKPPELLHLYREGLKQTGQNTNAASTQTDHDKNKEKIKTLEIKIEELKAKLHKLEHDNTELNNNNLKLQEDIKLVSNQLADISQSTIKSCMNESVGSESPERFEFIEKNMPIFRNKDSIEDNISNSSINTSEWMNVCSPTENSDSGKTDRKIEDKMKSLEINRSEDPFMKEVFERCYTSTLQNIDSDMIEDIVNETITADNFVNTVSSSLLKIIPNIILNKREDVIPLLIDVVHLNPKASERDKLLQQLFNLKKKPSEFERSMILTGLIAIAKLCGESMVENEILPQCWLQLTHKHIERRLLVAETCQALLPYVSSPIRNSLCLSMLQQMLEDKEEVVREVVIRALAVLMTFCNDDDKYFQCEQLAVNTLNDSSNSVVNTSMQILFPVLGKWALEKGHLSSSLMKKLLNKLNYYIKDTESPTKVNQSSDKILRIINVIENLLPFLLMSVATHENIMSNIEKDMAMELRPDFKNLCTYLTNPEIFYKCDVNCGMLLYEYDKYIAENPNMSWLEIDWIVDVMLPDLFNNLHHIEITQQSLLQSFINLFSHICIVFGTNFTKFKIRPLVQNKMQSLEQVISSFNQFCPSLNIIPVYFTVLTYCGDHEELITTLKKFLCALPLCGSPLDCLEITIRRLCEAGLQDIVIECLWSGIVHQRPLVRSAAASLFSSIIGICSKDFLKSKVTAALVTLASDNDILVRTATIPALGNLITDSTVKEIQDKAYMQLQTYLSDSNLKENHTFLRQLIVTLGNIVNSCSDNFRNDGMYLFV
ncbi:unnamed protein product [Acanthoscelides obtectus]|uniref:LisH domain-containing protein n=1 Tax=Acanthoscelides obtectus TaxID=200917 RepID=A0A9P0M184_ACAOB|nr:unnamed protein product [Acanthoscelides obtectus]CAK1647539.1 LisH domain and HEAT repeat-containing protein KIAA1468 [Acanthoscelides obtectus]